MSLGNPLPPISLRIFALSWGHHRSLRQADCMDWVLSQGETKQKRPGLFEPKARFQGAAEQAPKRAKRHNTRRDRPRGKYRVWPYKKRNQSLFTKPSSLIL